MRERKVRILHEGQEYFLLDRGREGHGRTIAFLRRLDDTKPPPDDAQRVLTDLGEYEWIASFNDGALHVEPAHVALAPTLQGIVTRYVDESRHGRARDGTTPYWYVAVRGEPVFELARALPHGLSVMVWSDEGKAEAAATARKGIESSDLSVERIHDLGAFLVACRNDGFAGATLDEHDPVFFCLDENEEPRHLRLAMDAKGKLTQRLLSGDGSWDAWDGDEDLNPEVDVESADEYMVARIGELPWLGYFENAPLYALARKGAPSAIHVEQPDADDSQATAFCPIFQETELAEDYAREHGRRGLEPTRIDDLGALASDMTRRGVTLFLHPDAHRARAATMWWSDGAVVLDSFSGLWKSAEHGGFEKT
ncbi:MAG: hypothetical protein IPH13_09310 [Planctomycetes bacterium]|nr:hypothetical protein [Planctomycetota bacterium]MCC7171140.1 hypothetical protein [Planctomycetota bacterium]